MNDKFDGDAISRADREFLKSLGNHPLMRNPLYSIPRPPLPNYAALGSVAAVEAAQEACFAAALDWMLVNYAFCKSAFMGKGGVISLVDCEMGSIASLRDFMQHYAIEDVGPRGGIKIRSVVAKWMRHPLRANIDKTQMRPDRPRPTFEEDGLHVYNRYWPPTHLTSNGEIETFKAFFARLVPDETERAWFWNYLAHKARKPWVPMVAVIMVAEEFGTGRGTLFDILELLFGKDYVVPCTFGELTGTVSGARFNDRLANALIATVNEAADEDGHQQARRRLNYEGLKNAVDPSQSARRRFEKKGHDAYAQESSMSTLMATNHRDVVKLPPADRRFCVLTCGCKMPLDERTKIRAWMAVPENIGALYQALLMTPAAPLDVFDPYGDPPPFAGRLEMIEMARSRIEDAYATTIDALKEFPLFTMTQAKRLIGYFGDYASGDWSNQALHTIAKNAYRLRGADEPGGRVRYLKRKEIVYTHSEAERRRWLPADKEMVVKQLERTKERIKEIINNGSGQNAESGEVIDIAAQLEATEKDKS